MVSRADEEPFLIFANRYYLRKLNLDGSNYTLLKQVREELGAGGGTSPTWPGVRGWRGALQCGDLPACELGLSAPQADGRSCINSSSHYEYTGCPM